jgi:hypothetical protein
MRLLDLVDINGQWAKQENFVLGAYYSHIQVSQEIFPATHLFEKFLGRGAVIIFGKIEKARSGIIRFGLLGSLTL